MRPGPILTGSRRGWAAISGLNRRGTPGGATALRGGTAWVRNVAAPVRDFLGNETGGAVVMLAAALLALLWANSPWWHSYESFWTTRVSVRVGDGGIALDLRHVVNQGLMTFFFVVVGLEAKRELDRGELRERRRITIPASAAAGGMAIPILIYTLFNAGGPGAPGWGAAMSTDTAFALGVLAIVAPTGARLRVALLTFAVVDDLVALLVIATVYTDHVSLGPLAIGLALFGLLLGLRFAPPAWRGVAALGLGFGVWTALLGSGIDPVITGLAVGLVTTAYPSARVDLERVTALARSFREQPTPELARSTRIGVDSAVPANDRLQYRVHPWTSFVIVPLFALANTGVHLTGGLLGDAIASPITLGIALGYVLGKPVGIMGAAWLASRLTGMRPSVSWPVLSVGGAVAGIGFTVSLLVASLAFHGRALEEAKLGVLAAAVLATGLAALTTRAIRLLPAEVRARQVAATREEILDLADDVDPERDHIRGAATAPVTLIEYGDYECPYCGQAEVTIRELLSSFGDELRYVWRHLPLNDVHQHAQLAAEAAEAAFDQGRFWAMHDLLLEHTEGLGPESLAGYAAAAGLDAERFWAAVRAHDHDERIARDVASADASGVAGTPTFFINGRRHEGAYDAATLAAAVRAARWRAEMLQRVPA
jgi:Na+/H+ antiporter NhaA